MTGPAKPEARRVQVTYRVCSEVRDKFKAVAALSGQTAEKRIEALMREDIEENLPARDKPGRR